MTKNALAKNPLPHPTGENMSRDLLDAIEVGAEFIERVTQAEGDSVKCADLMAEAINMNFIARGIEAVGKDGKSRLRMEELQSFLLHGFRACCVFARKTQQFAALTSSGENMTSTQARPTDAGL